VEGTFLCNPDFQVDPHDLFVDLDNSMFPIMGNTEQVTNSQGGTEEFDDATKLNEYVSWYLHGVNSKAEYGDAKNTANELVNFSGPIQKLMPGAFQDLQRIATIQSVTQEGASDPESEDANAPATEPQNHNQIVVCESLGRPVECPRGTPHRLKEWDDGNLSPYNTFINWFGADAWDKRVPPLPWQFEKDIYYQKAYMEWRGKTCSILFGKLICLENLLVPNMWANLFTYVPLANTVDKKGVEYIVTINFLPSGETQITGEDYGETKNAPLYFAHTQEDKELSEFLNSSYTPKDFSSVPLPETTEKNVCSALNVRSNPGDNLFPGTPHGFEIPDVTYKITQVECTETIEEVCSDRGGIEICRTVHQLTCPAEVVIEIPTNTKTPWAEDIWKTTVADSGSTFRKIFPKVETGAPVTCIADIPTVTNVDYDATKSEKPPGGDLTFKVGRKPEDAAGDTPQLTFPHIGSIYEYFLKGIQTALRPQGYGEPITDGVYCSNLSCGELPELPKSSGSCSLGGISSSVGNIPQSLKDIIEAAAQTYQVPPNLILGIMYGEGLFYGENAKDWTDENVKNWATCEPVPGCVEGGADDNFLGFVGSDWPNITTHIANDLNKLDPNRTYPSQCNLLDAIYGLAWNLHDSADGGGGLPNSCFGIELNASVPSSCDWTDEQYESAIKVAGSGYTDKCLTLVGSCASGGGLNAACPNGDSCETVGNYNPSNPSHNACVWNVAHGR
jgi:hypothetical protein